jgi:ADP-ribose pyrophosphatase
VQDRFVYHKDPGKTVVRDMVRHPGAVVILPFASAREIVLVHQFRWAAKGELWEIPAGTLEKGEKPLTCAKRELEEETGFRARRWRLLSCFYPAPGISDEKMWLYRADGLTPGRRNLDADEWMDVHTISVDKALQMMRRGEIRDGKTIAGVLWSLHPALARAR